MKKSKLDDRPPDLGTRHTKWMDSMVFEFAERIAALEAAVSDGPGPRPGVPETKQAHGAAMEAFPDWMRPHPQTKKTLRLKAAIMGFVPTKEEVQQRIAKLKPGVSYTKKQGAGIWNCSEAFALGWFFYIGHIVKTEFDTFSKSYKILEE